MTTKVSSSKPRLGSLARFHRFGLAVFRRAVRRERAEQPARGGGYFIDGTIECGFVGA
jgi:hypothetical protein